MRTLILGDIHGCYDELECLLSKVAYDKTKDKLYCVGDLVDRGPKTLDVLDFFMSNRDICSVMG